jgi:3'-phosphoadenosine 5'-phosphosulfate sulfotransferase (PAPS reductase)/FAD synthetase
VSWSSGKDSTVLVHLVKSIIPDALIISQIDDCDWPEKRPYVDRLMDIFGWKVFFAYPDFSVKDMILSENIIDVDICDLSHNITKRGFIEPLREMQKALNVEGVFLGLRSSESNARRLNFIKKGNLYDGSDHIYRCLPLEDWKAIDCFAYLASNGIEINPCYFYNRFLAPEEIRLCWAIPSFKNPYPGRPSMTEEHFRYYYSEQWETLRERKICH